MSRDDGFDAIVLAGGRGKRLGGIDKASLSVAGSTLLDRALAAVAGAERVVTVGDERPSARQVVWVRERTARAGPVHALAAGLTAIRSATVVVLAADLPFVDSACIARLTGTLRVSGRDGAVAVDPGGRRQPLLAAYRTAALRARLASMGPTIGAALSTLIDGLALAAVREDLAARDCDTWRDVEASRAALEMKQ